MSLALHARTPHRRSSRAHAAPQRLARFPDTLQRPGQDQRANARGERALALSIVSAHCTSIAPTNHFAPLRGTSYIYGLLIPPILKRARASSCLAIDSAHIDRASSTESFGGPPRRARTAWTSGAGKSAS